MTLEVWYWLFYVLSLFFGLWYDYTYMPPGAPPWRGGPRVVLYILLLIIGLRLFGPPVK